MRSQDTILNEAHNLLSLLKQQISVNKKEKNLPTELALWVGSFFSVEVESIEAQFPNDHSEMLLGEAISDCNSIKTMDSLGYQFIWQIRSSAVQTGLKSLIWALHPLLKDYLENLKSVDMKNSALEIQGARADDLAPLVKRVAAVESPVLIQGESGSGKERLARSIHGLSKRADRPLVAINCAAIPAELLESELFGHQKGAFTGAEKDRLGKFQQSSGGTLFLDEIGELPLDAQSKVLRVLEERAVTPLGSEIPVPLDLRIIAATNRNLEDMVNKGEFRKDLYFRLHVLSLRLPPLREKPEDILFLAQYFLDLRSNFPGEYRISTDCTEKMLSYSWPGNVRELENAMERAMVVSEGKTLTAMDLGLAFSIDKKSDKYEDKTLKDAVTAFKKKYLESVLHTHHGNQTAAAAQLGIQRTYLSRLIKELDVNR